VILAILIRAIPSESIGNNGDEWMNTLIDMKTNKNIYADYAATTPIKQEVLNEMLPYYENKFENPGYFYNESLDALGVYKNCKSKIAALFDCKQTEIIFTGSGSEANNFAIKEIAFHYKYKGMHLITTEIEHPSVYKTFKYLESLGFEVTYLPVDQAGVLSVDALKKAMRPDTILVSTMYVNNETGVIQPVKQIRAILDQYSAKWHVDAVQALGSLEWTLPTLNADAVTFSAHKIYASKGLGILYISAKTLYELDYFKRNTDHIYGGESINLPLIVGFAKALEINKEMMRLHLSHLYTLKRQIVTEILRMDSRIVLNGQIDNSHPGIMNFYIPYIDGDSMVINYDMNQIAISSGSACSSGALSASNVLLSMGYSETEAKKCIRISIGDFTTQRDADRIIEVTKKILDRL